MTVVRRPRVFVCSPLRGNGYHEMQRNLRYARAALRDSLMRGEAPYAPHLLYTLPGVLDDSDPEHRAAGIQSGLAFLVTCEILAVYGDLGISAGMSTEIQHHRDLGGAVDYRSVASWTTVHGGDA